MAIDRSRAAEVIRFASNAWRWRQVALERLAAGDDAGAARAVDLAVLAEAAASQIADSILESNDGSKK